MAHLTITEAFGWPCKLNVRRIKLMEEWEHSAVE